MTPGSPVYEAMIAERDKLRVQVERLTALWKARGVEIDRLRADIKKLLEALMWCSASQDFQEGGQAREGWLKLCKPLIDDEVARAMTREPTRAEIECEEENDELRAEVERLTAALAGIACWSTDHNDAKNRANRALEPKP